MSKKAIGLIISFAMVLLCLSFSVAIFSQPASKTLGVKKPVQTGLSSASKFKCDESKASCKSFLQLVASGDNEFLGALHGSPMTRGKHYAYACLEQKSDLFNIVYFDEPAPNEYQPFPYFKSKDADLVSEYRALHAGLSLRSDDLKNDQRDPLMLFRAEDTWFDDHDDFFTYSLPFVGVKVAKYRDGVFDDLEDERGKWRTDANDKSTSSDSETEFEGAFYWLENYNRDHDGKFAAVDLRDRLHTSITASQIFAHYDFPNQNHSTTHYSLTIQRATGRFVESLSTDDGYSDEQTGFCVIVKHLYSGARK